MDISNDRTKLYTFTYISLRYIIISYVKDPSDQGSIPEALKGKCLWNKFILSTIW